MAWKIEFDRDVIKDMKKIGKAEQKQIIKYLQQRIANSDNPREYGKPLRGKLSGLWRYRVGNHRIICQILDREVVVLVVKIGHRKKIYE